MIGGLLVKANLETLVVSGVGGDLCSVERVDVVYDSVKAGVSIVGSEEAWSRQSYASTVSVAKYMSSMPSSL
jgi:hypothetical protein